VSSPDTSIRLDTGAFGAARRRRAGRAAAYWLLLVAGAAVVAGGIALVTTVLQPSTTTARLDPKAARATAAAPAKAGASAKATAAAEPAKGGAAERKAPPAVPPARETPVVVWNGFGGQGAATAVADRARAAGYPVVGVRDAPRRTYRSTYVLFVPGRETAAKALARKLGLGDAAVRPLDGIRPAAIRPAQLLVILAG
jgi:hypothetical protein